MSEEDAAWEHIKKSTNKCTDRQQRTRQTTSSNQENIKRQQLVKWTKKECERKQNSNKAGGMCGKWKYRKRNTKYNVQKHQVNIYEQLRY